MRLVEWFRRLLGGAVQSDQPGDADAEEEGGAPADEELAEEQCSRAREEPQPVKTIRRPERAVQVPR
jgi:hypothetical protein